MRHHRGICALMLVFVLAGCSSPPAPPGHVPPSGWAGLVADVTGARPGPTPVTTIIDVLIPAGADCEQSLRATLVEQTATEVSANVAYDGPLDLPCVPTLAAEVTLTTDQPVGARDLTLNDQPWTFAGGPVYVRCSDQLGCHPPADHCRAVWTSAGVENMHVAPRIRWSLLHCDPEWLIVDVDLNGGCYTTERIDCHTPTKWRRYFLRWQGEYWQEVVSTTGGGCAAIQAKVPAFPTALCQDLKPTP